MKASYKAFAALSIVVLEISFWSIMLQIGGSRIGILPELFYGFLIGSVASVAISLAINRGRGIAVIARQPRMLGIIIAAGLFNDLLTQLFLGIGTLGTNASIGSILYRTWPIFVALLAPLVLRQKVRSMQYVAILIGFVGVYVIASSGTLASFGAAQAPYLGALLVAALCSAFSILAMNKYNVDTAGAIALFNVSSFIAITAIILATGTSISIALTPAVVISLLFLGIVAYAIGTMLYYHVVKSLGSLITGNAVLSVPFVTIIFSFLLLNTPIEPYYIAAALLISIGIFLQRHYATSQERKTRNRVLDRLTMFDVTGAFVSSSNKEIMQGIAGENRAFAIKLVREGNDGERHIGVFGKYDCVSFTSKKPHWAATAEEMLTIRDAMDLGEGETALIGMGHPDRLEDAFAEFVSSAGALPEEPETDWKR